MFIFYLVALIIIISVQTDFITERSILGTSIIFTSLYLDYAQSERIMGLITHTHTHKNRIESRVISLSRPFTFKVHFNAIF